MTDVIIAIRPEPPAARSPMPCPFCGAAAVMEAHPDHSEILRIACRDEGCRIRPATEYLLAEYADELRAAWDGRAGAPWPRLRAAAE